VPVKVNFMKTSMPPVNTRIKKVVRYESILATIEPDEAYEAVANMLINNALAAVKDFDMKEKLENAIRQWHDIAVSSAADAYYLMYSYIVQLKDEDEINNEALKELRDVFDKIMRTKDYQITRTITRLNRNASMVYAIRYTVEFFKKLAEKIDFSLLPESSQPQGLQEEDGEIQNGSSNGRGGRNEKETGEPGQATRPASNKNIDHGYASGGLSQATREAIREAVKYAHHKALQATKNYQELGGEGQGFDPAEIAFIDEEPDMTIDFQAVIEILGKIRRSMPLLFYKPRTEDRQGDIEGYTITPRPEKAIARELALPDELFTSKLASNSFITKRRVKPERGVMIVLVDVSGSMEGRKIAWAKAVAYALYLKAQREKLEYVAIPFNYSPGNPITNPLDLLKLVASGGTSITRAIDKAFELAETKKLDKANIIIITDGIDDLIDYEAIITRAKKSATIKVIYIEGENKELEKIARATKGELLTVEPTIENAIKIINKA